MKLEWRTILHIICKVTQKALDRSLKESADDVWKAYVQFFVNPYTDYSKRIH